MQRLLSTSSYASAKKATYTNSIVILPITFIPWLIGLAIFTYYHQNPDPRVTSGDAAFFMFVSTKMPPPLPGLILASMLAAAMSTLDSAMNSLSAVLVKDFYLRSFRPDASEAQQVRLARILTVAIGILGAGLAITINATSSSLQESVIEIGAIWGSFAVVLGPVYLLGVTSRRVNSRVIWIGILACWGATLGMIFWYARSKTGHTTANSALWWTIPLAAGLVFVLLGVTLRNKRFGFPVMCLGVFALGTTTTTLFWYVMSHSTDGGTLSFLWISFPGLMLLLLIGYGSIPLLRESHVSHHTGLTLWSNRQDVQDRVS